MSLIPLSERCTCKRGHSLFLAGLWSRSHVTQSSKDRRSLRLTDGSGYLIRLQRPESSGRFTHGARRSRWFRSLVFFGYVVVGPEPLPLDDEDLEGTRWEFSQDPVRRPEIRSPKVSRQGPVRRSRSGFLSDLYV